MDVAEIVILAFALPIFAPTTSLAAPTSAVVGGLETTLLADRLPGVSALPSSSSSTLWTSVAEAGGAETSEPVSTASPGRSARPGPGLAPAPAPAPAPGPGAVDGVRSCLVDGATWQHGQQVVRSDQCEFCLCFDGEVFCWWQDCPPPTGRGPCQGSEPFTPCNSFSENGLATNDTDELTAAATIPSSFTATTTTEVSASTPSVGTSQTSAEPPVLCKILGTVYRVGEVLPRDTGSCLECECGSYGRIVCGPKDCLPVRDAETASGPDAANSLDMFDVDTF